MAATARNTSVLRKGEGEERRSRGEGFGLGPNLRIPHRDERAPPRRGHDVLFAAHGVADGRAPVAGAGVEAKELRSPLPVESVEPAFGVAIEDEASARRKNGSEERVLRGPTPLQSTRHRIVSGEPRRDFPIGRRHDLPELAPEENLTHARLLFPREDHGAPLDGGIEEELRFRAVARLVPAPGPDGVGADELRLPDDRLVPVLGHAVLVETARPVDRLRERPGGDELPVGPIDDVHVAALVRMDEELPHASMEDGVDENALVGAVVVPEVMGDLLEVPDDFAGVGIDRHDAIGVEVLTHSSRSVEVGGGVPDAPVEEVEPGIVGARHPGGAPSIFPAVSRPGLVPLLAGSGNGVEPPAELSRLPVESDDVPPMGRVSAGRAHDDHVFDDDRGSGDVAAEIGAVLDVDLEHLLTRLRVEGDDEVIDRSEVQVAVAEGDAPVLVPVGAVLLGNGVEVVPQPFAGSRVEGEHPVLRTDDVEDTVGYERGRLEPEVDYAQLERPGDLQPFHIRGVDLIERAESPGLVVPAVSQPVLRLGRGPLDPGGGDFLAFDWRRRENRPTGEERKRPSRPSHPIPPPRANRGFYQDKQALSPESTGSRHRSGAFGTISTQGGKAWLSKAATG